MGRKECNLLELNSIEKTLNTISPNTIINAAAYTDVDGAESVPDIVKIINTDAVSLMARHIKKLPGGILIHFSTDYIFDDSKKSAYLETDIPKDIEKLSVYAKSKLDADIAIEKIFDQQVGVGKYFILRSSWIYGDGENFIRKISELLLMNKRLSVVSDQLGIPTSAKWLAEITLLLLNHDSKGGLYHVVPDGCISWYELSIQVATYLASQKLISNNFFNKIRPILAKEYPSIARRPYNSMLDNSKLKTFLNKSNIKVRIPIWTLQVENYLKSNEYFKNIRS